MNSIFNKREAFRKCVETKEFKAWHRVETMKRLGQLKNIDKVVDEQMNEKNLKIEEYIPSNRDYPKGIMGQ